MPNSVPSFVVRSMPSVQLGNNASDNNVEVSISLKPRDMAGLKAFADSVSDPKSPNYRNFMTADEVGEQFGALKKDVDAVSAFFITNGLKVTHVGRTNQTIAATGTVAQVEAMFNTKIAHLVDATGTIQYRSNVTALNVPINLVDKIQSINGVETYTRPKARGNSLTPTQARTLYSTNIPFTSGWTGSGRTIGISSWDGFLLSNANLFISNYSLPVPGGGAGSNITVVHVGAGSQSGSRGGEGDLDFQMVLGSAPLAHIVIFDGTGGNLPTVLSTEASTTGANACDIITESYGWSLDAATATTCNTTHVAMTAIGMTYMAASGDSGPNFTDPTSGAIFDYPDYDPEVLSVGGTIASTDASGNRTAEVAWSNSGGNGGGGGWGYSAGAGAAFNVRPSWQVGTGVPTVATINKRICPDLALHASGNNGFTSPFAYFAYYNGALTTFSGTSASSPLFAAGLGIVEQRLYSTGGRGANTNKGRLGRIQDKVYAQNGRSDIWFDITSGSTGTLHSSGGGSLNGQPANATAGWDFATGWGAINFDKFYKSFFEAR